ncbi:MAG: hypothetical protein HZA66_10780 [Rhodopseudomonas palustris]|uniref:Uncharacterized protein n=1 Tax=Rhodopseudomonas palustris TaxID=1076 RepID=A0A933RZM1_RHOPL|nr:hypothetical protein [Rhodopseudomonas palustris]
MPCRPKAAVVVATIAVIGIAFVSAPVSAAPWRADEGNTRGWMLMSPQERIEHQARVRGFTDYDTCAAYRAEHHALMMQRARERGLDLPGSHWDFCSRLKRGAPRD